MRPSKRFHVGFWTGLLFLLLVLGAGILAVRFTARAWAP